MDASVTVTGRIGTDIEKRVTRQGVEYARFRLASTPRILRAGEWSDGDTTWYSVRCYRSVAHNVALSVRKGDPVLVTGRMRTESWVDEDGVLHEQLVIDASGVGHDLAWGSATFRTERRRSAEPAGPDATAQPEPEPDPEGGTPTDADREGLAVAQ
ncbi:single-stranded DNA-binding protein [Granulicoccus phenolivorans]|uniref:single-stranded DNA-binding protein n=1 Tax=Granulicoccus phenolivorans TaxID=266854 RepID=UPI0003F7778F|nr:single-stranded DNA-binding protein [Granulicoccus phenolivorans]